MTRIPDYAHNLSIRLSQVVGGDVMGVNEKMVKKRRRMWLLNESIFSLTQQLHGNALKWFVIGSQIEGTTTPELQSDTDWLGSINIYNVIQDLSEWEYGKQNLLMIQDENVSLGYCFLQILRDDAPLPQEVEVNDHSYTDGMGRILLKNTFVNVVRHVEAERNGPAHSLQRVPGVFYMDIVNAFPCQTRSVQPQHWLNQHMEGHWPTNDMIQFCRNTGCFVVGVGKKGSFNEVFEWRISTSLAERYLMLNLNLTQIRCYVLMKMILKTFIPKRFSDIISSFICKTVLLHCISYTRFDEWKENNIFICLSFYLSTLYNCVQNEYCPHFFITQNNLMSERFTPGTKPLILETLRYVIESNGRALLEIECDNFGLSLQSSLNGFLPRDAHFISTHIAGFLLTDTVQAVNKCAFIFLRERSDNSPRQTMQNLLTLMPNHHNDNFTNIDRIAYRLITQQLCGTLGTIIASSNIKQLDHLTYKKAISFMSLGIDTDVASRRLKLASMFYCAEDIEKTELILKNIEERYDLSVVEPMCTCYDFKKALRKKEFNRSCYESNVEFTLLKHITALCVCFIRCEINCCPLELQREMFRSTQEDFTYRSEDNEWMDMAVVDSLPYLYFLQYKTYSRLGRLDDKQRALSNISRTIDNEPNLGHRETALNLLGQCMEQEYRKDDALKCFLKSLKIRSRNNAAKVHIFRLIASSALLRQDVVGDILVALSSFKTMSTFVMFIGLSFICFYISISVFYLFHLL
ncbi:uncharacterized protein LOC132746425 isoform X1 [Ruditapes philippinarum]|uniref:uncharacterized protein LOC132746425 isoform X1 n=1 Tax=Ruditapes philippinarum TaxID=129788 RepID=UPI00295A7E21|nr:uncharacterized protein LOC132746425 isoform X1 [Ruditapes philippinarum]